MSEPATTISAAPPLTQVVGVYAGMALTRLRRGKVIYFTLSLLALPVVVAIIAVIARSWGASLFRQVLTVYTDFLLLFVPAIHAAPALGEEIDARTFTYVFARPAPRWAMPLGKYLATALVLVVGCTLSVALTYLVCMLRDPSELGAELGLLGRAATATCLGAIAFGALATAIGALFPRRPVVAALVYLLLIEGLFGHIPGFLKAIALSFHLRVVAGLNQAGGSSWEPNPGALVSLLVLVIASVVFLYLGSVIVSSSEYRTDK
ncbi:MAG TPA: ABC transporter permease [Polyangia bacterium]|jgi:ABC-type transport system involved in multi-copper enzyme maturation permease subunit